MVSDIQEFYELTLLDETKTVQQKTAETLQMASKWETNNQQQQQQQLPPPPPAAAVIIPTRFGDIQQQQPGLFPLEVFQRWFYYLKNISLALYFQRASKIRSFFIFWKTTEFKETVSLSFKETDKAGIAHHGRELVSISKKKMAAFFFLLI